jgi:hypothetical protein
MVALAPADRLGALTWINPAYPRLGEWPTPVRCGESNMTVEIKRLIATAGARPRPAVAATVGANRGEGVNPRRNRHEPTINNNLIEACL